jgi:Xaa-Pro aminopeptidase
VSALADRADRLTELAAARELDLLVVSDLVNVRYLTRYGGTNGIVVIGPDVRIFGTDFRYYEGVRATLSEYEVRRAKTDILEVPASVVTERRPEGGQPGARLRVGFDDAHLTVRAHRRLGELLGDAAELVPAGGLVEELRAVKGPDEIDAMRRAAAIADDLYRWLVGEHGLAGHTERAVALALEQKAKELGADALSFPPIVAEGANGAQPHAEPRAVEIPRDTLVVVDLGCLLDGYCSDCTRTFATGPLDGDAAAVYELVRQAQAAALAEVRAGAGARELDGVARRIIEQGGHGEEFGHGLGHGVGLEVHEAPRLTPRAEGALVSGNAVTVEPGVYVSGRFGVRIEDLAIVTDDGCEILTSTSKDLITV